MKRFSIGFTADEYRKLEEIKAWYEERVGVRVSRCGVIKKLLFDAWQVHALNLSHVEPTNHAKNHKSG